jgi:YesN/AraC family two-component response regulator
VIQDRSYAVKKGDLYIINVNTAHMFCADKNATEPFVAYDLMFTPEFFDRALAGNYTFESLGDSYMFRSFAQNQEAAQEAIGVSGDLYTMFRQLFDRMYQEYRNRKIGYMEIIRGYLLQVLITAIRLKDETKKSHSVCNKEHVVRVIADQIKAQNAGRLSIQELADSVYLSADYLGRIFREITGESISSRIQRVRIQHACHMLTATERTISDIATACGFQDTKFFYSTFKKIIGIAPGDYRNQTRVDT